jgi:putative membrane-bound dehydrogenase-like protein
VRALVVICCLVLMGGLAAQQSPEQSAAEVRTPPGLQATLWASEPMVTNPTNMTVDERGRLWILEAVNYRRALRNQSDHRPAGDRIVVLEDTDRDGRGDKVTVFDQSPEIRAPLGIAVLGNKVYVSQSPSLTVYTKDDQDRIVNKEVLLTGFGGVDHDHGLHAVVFGPDGKYYFNHGNTGFSVTDRSGRTLQGSSYENVPLNRPDAGYFQGVAFRMNPDGSNLEVLAQNFRNPYELTVDSFGNVWQTDNDDDGNAWTRLNYVMEGGNFGFFGPLHRTWNADRGGHFHNELPGVVPNVLRLGPGSPCGLLLYEGRLLPGAFRGRLLHAEAGKRIVGSYTIIDDGAGFTATIEELAFGGADTWFRPSDVAVAPDGAVFVADWYDPGVGGHNMADPQGGRGRIYRIAPAGHRPLVPALDLQSEQGLTEAFGSPTQAVRYLAHQAIVARGSAAAPMLQRLWRQSDPILRARALWILGGLPTVGPAAIEEALRDRDPRFRILGLRVARLHGADMLATVAPLLRDSSPRVRREVALLLRDPDPVRMQPPYLSTLQTAPPARWLDAMMTLIAQYDGKDRWYLEALAIAARGREDAIYARLRAEGARQSGAAAQVVWALRPKSALPDLIATINDASRPMAERELALDTVGHMEWPEATRAIETFILNETSPPTLAGRAFTNYGRQLFSLWPDARTSPALPRLVRRGLSLPPSQTAAVDLVGRLVDRQFLPDLAALAVDEAAVPDARAAAVTLLSTTSDDRYLANFRALAATAPTPVRVAAVRAVGGLPQPDTYTWAQTILLSDAPNEVRVEALRVMALSAAGLHALLDLAEQGRLPAEFRSLAASLTNNAGQGRGGFGRGRGGFAATPNRGSGPATGARAAGAPQGPGRGGPTLDPALGAVRERAATVLPLPAAAGRTIPGIAALERNHRGNAGSGRRVFEVDGACAACHSLGGARKIGPDLSAIGLKYGKQAMLDHIVRPNDAIGHEYVTTTFETKAGETVTGILTDQRSDHVVVRLSDASERRLQISEIAARRQSGASLMPEGLLDQLSLQQISDLLEFLATLRAAGRTD